MDSKLILAAARGTVRAGLAIGRAPGPLSPPTNKSQKARPSLLLTSCLTDSTSSTNLEPSKSASSSASKPHWWGVKWS